MRTLTATGASSATRRMITGLAWAHSSLSAAAGGWLLAGREPPLITRQPIE